MTNRDGGDTDKLLGAWEQARRGEGSATLAPAMRSAEPGHLPECP